MSRMVISPPHPILFVYDPTNKDVVDPVHIDDQLTVATESSVSVKVQASVDGDVDICLDLGDTLPSSTLYRAFSGRIATPGGKIAIVTSELEPLLDLDVPKGSVAVCIWVDDVHRPAQVVVTVMDANPSSQGA